MSTIDQIDFEPESYPFADTHAATILAEAFNCIWKERGLSQRQLAPKLGYRTSVPLSHMALGRAPVPVEKVSVLASVLGLDEAHLLLAVLEQRYPAIDFKRLLQPTITELT